MTETCLISAVKDEGPDLLEWIAYHRLIGFTSILIHSNDCTDGSDGLLDALGALGWITHVRHSPPADLSAQDAVARLAIAHPRYRAAEWAIWLDADEFLVAHAGDGSVGTLLAQAGGADALALNWRLFGDSGQTHSSDALVTETFTMAATPETRQARTVKTLYRTNSGVEALFIHRPVWSPTSRPYVIDGAGRALGDDFVHGVKKNGRPVEMLDRKGISYELAQINHYAIKALDRVAIKQHRGNGLLPGAAGGRFGFGYLRRFNHNHQPDTALSRHLPALRATMAEALADPEVARAHAACHAAFAAMLERVRPTTLALAADRTGQAAKAAEED